MMVSLFFENSLFLGAHVDADSLKTENSSKKIDEIKPLIEFEHLDTNIKVFFFEKIVYKF